MYVDRNMVDEPYFRIAAEGNRGVFVPAESINTKNGATDWMQGRKSDKVGRVLDQRWKNQPIRVRRRWNLALFQGWRTFFQLYVERFQG